MTPEEKKEYKRLYDIEYRKKNAVNIAKKKKEKYDNLSESEKKELLKKQYARLDKDIKKQRDVEYAKNNKVKLNKKKKAWAIANKEKVRESKTKHHLKKLKEDPLFKLKHNTICGILQSFKRNGYTKKSRSYVILGCSFEEFKLHLESKFESWMNWDNYGNKNGTTKEPNKTWDLDHIIPLSSAKTEEDVIRLNHYTNLQPLCSYVNRWVKSNNY
jgi:uncharacterized protein YdaT